MWKLVTTYWAVTVCRHGGHTLLGFLHWILKPPCEVKAKSSSYERDSLAPGPCTTFWALHSLLGDRIICRWFFFFKSNRVGSNLHSALIRLIWWQQNKNYFLWLHREFPDPDEGQGTLLGSDKGGQGTQMTRLENRKCPERDGKVVRSWGGVSKRKSQMGMSNSKIPT